MKMEIFFACILEVASPLAAPFDERI